MVSGFGHRVAWLDLVPLAVSEVFRNVFLFCQICNDADYGDDDADHDYLYVAVSITLSARPLLWLSSEISNNLELAAAATADGVNRVAEHLNALAVCWSQQQLRSRSGDPLKRSKDSRRAKEGSHHRVTAMAATTMMLIIIMTVVVVVVVVISALLSLLSLSLWTALQLRNGTQKYQFITSCYFWLGSDTATGMGHSILDTFTAWKCRAMARNSGSMSMPYIATAAVAIKVTTALFALAYKPTNIRSAWILSLRDGYLSFCQFRQQAQVKIFLQGYTSLWTSVSPLPCTLNR